jgi:hypothetical protein
MTKDFRITVMESELMTQYESAKYIVETNKQPYRLSVNQLINSEIDILLDGTVKLPRSDELNGSLTPYAKFWT